MLDYKNLEDAVTNVLFSLRTTKHSATKQSPFFRHFNRKPNTTASNALSNILDSNLKRSLLTPEDRRRQDYSKYRLKKVGLRDNSEEVNFMFARPSAMDKTTAATDTLNRLASSINEWNHLTEETQINQQ